MSADKPGKTDLYKPEDAKTSSSPWMGFMRSGNFAEAWQFSDEMLRSGVNRNYSDLPRHFQCIWDGTPLKGKRVLVRCYHGLGDTIQFIRYVPMLKQIAAQVIVWAQEPLIALLKTVPGIDVLLPLHDGIPDVDYDTDVEVMELPHIFRSTVDAIPANMPYLNVEPILLSANKNQLNVGLAWKPGEWDQSRCIPFSLLEPLANIEDVNLYILQANAEAAGWREGVGINPGEFSLYDYARVIKGLDLMITADSMPAHLAGALNVPVWTMLHAHADWRWMDNRTDSPWYPSMRLFRQKEQGQWEPVVEQIIEELKRLTQEKV